MSEQHIPERHTERPQRIFLLTTPSSYRAPAFCDAAQRLGIEVVQVVDRPAALAAHTKGDVSIDFDDHAAALAHLVALAERQPPAAIIAVDDSGTLLAAQASDRLRLPHNDPHAALAARNKFVMRERLAQRRVPVPHYRLCRLDDDLEHLADTITYPCVVKPLELNGSRGVIRADDPAAFVAAVRRLAAMLRGIYPPRNDTQAGDEGAPDGGRHFLVEEFIPGVEVALEGIVDDGRLQVLALFDKPDPLDGPFFEETIYVTPSRLPGAVQDAIARCAADAAAALGLHTGPVHAELRINERGPFLIEAAGRSIGGLCSRTLQFGSDASLEELIIRQACGLPIESMGRVGNAGGVMMIPIPEAGILRSVDGLPAAQAVPGVESVEVTAPLHNELVPLPEGESYLGFIFARADTPEAVENALRTAHARLNFRVVPDLKLGVLGLAPIGD